VFEKIRVNITNSLIKIRWESVTTYYNLTVYKQSYDLLLDIFKLTKEFNWEYKYTIGEKFKVLRNCSNPG